MRTYLVLYLYHIYGATDELTASVERMFKAKGTDEMREALIDIQKKELEYIERENRGIKGEEPDDEGGGHEENGSEPVLKPYRTITVSLDKGKMVIKSESEEPENDYEIEYPEQLTNEFLIQAELLEIRKWDPMHYSEAFAGKSQCRWVLDYNGLKGGETVKAGRGVYPKGWPVLMDLIDAYNDGAETAQNEGVHVAAGYAAGLIERGGRPGSVRKEDYDLYPLLDDPDFQTAEDIAMRYTESPMVRTIDMVYLLSVMRMPQYVIAAGIVRAVALEHGYDDAEVRGGLEGPVAELLDEYGDDWDLPETERRIALIQRVRNSEREYFRILVLAEVMSMLIKIKAGVDMGEGFSDSEMSLEEMGLYYAEMISALGSLEKDEHAGAVYSVLLDMYKTLFVSYSLDSVRGVIYQVQGDAAGVMLSRGDYDWKPLTEPVSEEACPIGKDLAMFLADRWKKQADEAIVKGGARAVSDVPDLRALKVVMSMTKGGKTRKDNKAALAVLTRMVDEGEHVLAALHAGPKELSLIERGDIEDVSKISVSFLGLEDDEGNKMAAVFTSMEEAGDIDQNDIKAVPVSTLLRFVKHMDRLDGIIIDPFSDRFLVTKERIAEMLDGLNKEPAGM